MRIGLFGGTFNPIHNGHIEVAKEVRIHAALDMIYFIPSLLPPHKNTSDLVDARLRQEMIRESLKHSDGLAFSDIEIERPGPSYTIDTVKYYQETTPKSTSLFLIMGMDAFLEIDTWKSYKELFRLIAFIVMTRNEPNFRLGDKKIELFETYLRSNISNSYTSIKESMRYQHPVNQPIEIKPVSAIDVSSSKIRERIRQGKTIEDMVPEAVVKIIKAKGLYR